MYVLAVELTEDRSYSFHFQVKLLRIGEIRDWMHEEKRGVGGIAYLET